MAACFLCGIACKCTKRRNITSKASEHVTLIIKELLQKNATVTDPELELFLKMNTFVIQASWETNKDIVATYKIYYCCFLLW